MASSAHVVGLSRTVYTVQCSVLLLLLLKSVDQLCVHAVNKWRERPVSRGIGNFHEILVRRET